MKDDFAGWCNWEDFPKMSNMNAADLRVYSSGLALVNVQSIVIYLHEIVKLHFKHHPHVPNEYQENILYCWPDTEVMLIVKEERSKQSFFEQS